MGDQSPKEKCRQEQNDLSVSCDTFTFNLKELERVNSLSSITSEEEWESPEHPNIKPLIHTENGSPLYHTGFKIKVKNHSREKSDSLLDPSQPLPLSKDSKQPEAFSKNTSPLSNDLSPPKKRIKESSPESNEYSPDHC